jgi:MFS family permease
VNNQPPVDNLLSQIRKKRALLETFIARQLPRKRRLLNVTIVGGTLAAAFTAGPAFGGQSFTQWLTMALSLTSPSWRLLCAGAAVCSVTATMATQLLKSQNLDEHVARAQSCRAKLEVLEIGLTTQTIPVAQATTEYLRCVEDTAFLEPA